jgi:glyoxylase-like metal-dependent hydrolase (beta-lactamase superfamily II)
MLYVLSLLIILLMSIVAAVDDHSGFNIYWINVGQGAAQLIKFPSGYTILIDTGQDVGLFKQPRQAELVAEQIKAIVGELRVNVVVATHGDLDHIGKPEKGGIWWLIEESGLKITDKIGTIFYEMLCQLISTFRY